jgi:hypothetical protein
MSDEEDISVFRKSSTNYQIQYKGKKYILIKNKKNRTLTVFSEYENGYIELGIINISPENPLNVSTLRSQRHTIASLIFDLRKSNYEIYSELFSNY